MLPVVVRRQVGSVKRSRVSADEWLRQARYGKSCATIYFFLTHHFFHQLAERVGGQLPPSMLEGLGSDIAKVADTLRSEITILVPELVGLAHFDI